MGKCALPILALIGLLSFNAMAQNKGSQFGIVYGYSVPDAENTDQYHLTGVKGEAFVLPNITAGGYYIVSDGAGEPSVLDKFRYSIHGIQVAYHMPASGGETFFAFRMGLSKVRATRNAEDVVFSPYHYGMAVGYDYFLGSMFSVGFEGSYVHAERGKTQQAGTTLRLDSFNVISFMLAFQLRL